MKSLFDFIVKPINKRYDNEIKIGDKSLITNANTENFRAVSNMAGGEGWLWYAAR